MGELGALALFSFVSAVTPGPNNVMLSASGVQFGLRRTVPHVVGVGVGIGVMAVAVAAGIGAVMTAVPQLELVLKIAGSAYLLYLAYQIAGSRAVGRSTASRPLGVTQAAAFQFVNPKAWFFVIAALSTFRPDDIPLIVGSAAMVIIMVAVVWPSAALWAAGGTAIGRFVEGERASRVVGVVLATLLAATVVYIWV